jgi:hypothetical protein
MWLWADFDLGRAYAQARTGRQMLEAQIEIDVQLIAGKRPALAALRNQRRESRVDQRELVAASPFAERPAVSDEPALDAELGRLQHFALARLRPAYDHRQRAVLAR